MRVSFAVQGPPQAQGSMVLMRGRIRHSTSGKLTAWRNAVGWSAKAAMTTQPWTGPVTLRVLVTLLGDPRVPMVKAPDLDKLVRAVGDALTGIVWVDDKQVVGLTARKVYGLTPGVEVTVEAE